MLEQKLNLVQNICAARVFLNIFDLMLDDVLDIDESSKIKIFDYNTNEVGLLSFDSNNVKIVANCNDYLLNASYEFSTVSGFVDYEFNNALFGQWVVSIDFNLSNNKDVLFSGDLSFDCSVDSEYGMACLCRPLVVRELPNGDKYTLKILRNNRAFGAYISSVGYTETIDIRPKDDVNGFIVHVISKGKYDPKSYMYEYRKYMGIFAAGIENENELRSFLLETELGRRISYVNSYTQKEGEDDSKELLIQKGRLMQELDPDMFYKIKELRTLFSIGEVSLLDNLISVCYDFYSDEEVESFIGIKRSKMNYQDGANSLLESYFGIGMNNKFLSIKPYELRLQSVKNSI